MLKCRDRSLLSGLTYTMRSGNGQRDNRAMGCLGWPSFGLYLNKQFRIDRPHEHFNFGPTSAFERLTRDCSRQLGTGSGWPFDFMSLGLLPYSAVRIWFPYSVVAELTDEWFTWNSYARMPWPGSTIKGTGAAVKYDEFTNLKEYKWFLRSTPYWQEALEPRSHKHLPILTYFLRHSCSGSWCNIVCLRRPAVRSEPGEAAFRGYNRVLQVHLSRGLIKSHTIT